MTVGYMTVGVMAVGFTIIPKVSRSHDRSPRIDLGSVEYHSLFRENNYVLGGRAVRCLTPSGHKTDDKIRRSPDRRSLVTTAFLIISHDGQLSASQLSDGHVSDNTSRSWNRRSRNLRSQVRRSRDRKIRSRDRQPEIDGHETDGEIPY